MHDFYLGDSSRPPCFHDEREFFQLFRINLPLRFVASMLPAIRSEGLDRGIIRVDDIHKGNVDVDLPVLVKALREAEDGEFVTVEEKDETVRIEKTGEKILIHVDDRGGQGESVEIEMRMKVLDALLSAGPDELNLLAAVAALEAQGESELVRVRDGEETVRIWIDTKSTMD